RIACAPGHNRFGLPAKRHEDREAAVSFLLQRSDVGEFRRRYRWLVLVVLVAFMVVIGRLVQLQLIEGDVHRAQARRNIVRERYLATTRGVLRDANGRVLAANRPSYTVYVTPSKIDLETTWPKLQKLLELDQDERKKLDERLRRVRAEALAPRKPGEKERRTEQQLLLQYDVDRDVVAWLETHEPAGGEVAPTPVRYYPYGELAAHLLGYMREVDAEALARLEGRGYRAGDRIGAVGVERRWESYLRGQRGMKKILRGLRGNLSRENVEALEAKYLEEPRRIEPVPGRDISLTIDIDLIASIERAMRGQLAGAVTVIDVRTG